MIPSPRAFAAVLLLVSACAPPVLVAAARPNVLFIMVDDLNDWVGFLRGHPQTRTPNMDRLAARGVVFANANCASPLCAPSRAAIFSGREPFRSGVYGNEDDIRQIAPELVLLPQHFRKHGYRTCGTGKLLHQRRPDLFDESFFTEQRWSPFDPKTLSYTAAELPSKGTDNPRHVVRLAEGQPVVLPLNRMPSDRQPDKPAAESFDWGPIDLPDEAMGDTKVASWAVERLRAPASQPFFLAVGFYRPHIPLFAPTRYFAPFPVESTELPLTRPDDLSDVPPVARVIATTAVTAGSHHSVLRHEQWKAAVAAYLACVHYVDAQIGRVLDALDTGPHSGNTLVVLLGDHGWHLGEKEHWGKSTGWERSVRAPLVIVPPGRRAPEAGAPVVCREPVSLIDLYPTLNDMCGLDAPSSPLDGQSLVPLLREPAASTGRAVVSTFHGQHFSVRDERWRLIRYGDGSEELYDMRSDPSEWRNVALRPENAPVKARLARALPGNPVRPRGAASENASDR